VAAGAALEVAEQLHAQRVQRPQVEVVAAAVAGGEDVGEEPSLRGGQRAHRLVDEARLYQPPEEVVAAEPAGGPRRAAAREEDLAPGLVQLLRELAAGLPAADHEHRPGREAGGLGVVVGVEARDAVREHVGERRAVRPLVGAAAEHDPAGEQVARRCLQPVAPAGRGRDGAHVDLLPHRHVAGVALEVGDDLVPWHVAVGVVAVVAAAGQLDRPVRRHEAERRPAIAPALPDAPALQHHVLDPGAGELVAHRQARLTGADDDRLGHLPTLTRMTRP
jgi:hypothetical protein